MTNHIEGKIVVITGASMAWEKPPLVIWQRKARKSSWARAEPTALKPWSETSSRHTEPLPDVST